MTGGSAHGSVQWIVVGFLEVIPILRRLAATLLHVGVAVNPNIPSKLKVNESPSPVPLSQIPALSTT